MTSDKEPSRMTWYEPKRPPRCRCLLLLLVGCAYVTGCAPSGPETADVTGTVLLDGEPVPHASVTFYPTAGRPSYGTADENGVYQLIYARDQPGAVVGEHSVKLSVGGPGPPSPVGEPQTRRNRSKTRMISAREVTLEESIEVVSGENQIDLVVPPE